MYRHRVHKSLDRALRLQDSARDSGSRILSWYVILASVVVHTLTPIGCVFLLSCWYVRYEVQKRFSAFYLLALLASGFSNILAWALSLMDGIGNLAGWRWIFVMEGIITCVLGLMGYVLIVDFPDKSTRIHPITRKAFLTVDEAKIVLGRIERDRGDAVVDKLTFQTIKQHLRDWKIWEYAWLYLLNNTVAYSFGFFLPIILRTEMNYSVTLSQVLSFPPYAAACPWMFATAWVADRYRKRGLILIFNCAAAILGVAMMGFIRSSPGARYTGVFLAVCGANANVPTILSYMHNNIVGQMKRSIASALLIGGGAMGGKLNYRHYWSATTNYCQVLQLQTSSDSKTRLNMFRRSSR